MSNAKHKNWSSFLKYKIYVNVYRSCVPDFVFETLFFMNYDVRTSPSYESSAMKHLASMSCQTSLGIFQVMFVCLII